MGVVRNIINQADNTPGMTAEIKENLNVLMSLAETRANLFQEEIKVDLINGKTTDDLTVPITKVMSRLIEYRAITKDSTSDTLEKVTDSIKDMISSKGSASSILTGVAKIANDALNTIMGCGEGQELVKKIYVVAADYPSIVRFDFAFWIRSVTATSIRSHMEKVLSCVAFKSAVDVTKLEFNDFLTLYGPILNESFEGDKKEITRMINESMELFNMFKRNDTQLRSASAQPSTIADTEDTLPEIKADIEAINQQLTTVRATGAQNKVKQLGWTDGQDPLDIVMNSSDILSRTTK